MGGCALVLYINGAEQLIPVCELSTAVYYMFSITRVHMHRDMQCEIYDDYDSNIFMFYTLRSIKEFRQPINIDILKTPSRHSARNDDNTNTG